LIQNLIANTNNALHHLLLVKRNQTSPRSLKYSNLLLLRNLSNLARHTTHRATRHLTIIDKHCI